MSKISADRSWAFNAKELIKEIGTRLGFKVEEEYQVDPQVYLSDKGEFSHLYTDSRKVDLVWFETRGVPPAIQEQFPFLSNRIVLGCEIEASFDTKRMMQSVNNLERLRTDLGMIYVVLSVGIGQDIEKALSYLHVARLRLSTPIFVVTDLEVWHLYSILKRSWDHPNDKARDLLCAYVEVLKRRYAQAESTHPTEIASLRGFWRRALDGDTTSQFFMNVPRSFRRKIQARMNSFLNP